MNRKLRLRARKILGVIKGPIIRLVTAFLVAALCAVIGLLVSNNGPAPYLWSTTKIDASNPFKPQDHFRAWDANFSYSVIMDVHHHPNGIDPDLLIQWFLAAGYNAVVLTEHNTIQESIKVQKYAQEKYPNFTVIVGMEWTNCRVHMGFLGISKMVDIIKLPNNTQLQAVIDNVHAQGGVVVYNHPPWSTWAGLEQPTFAELVSMGVDYFDITTSERLDLQTIYYCEENNIGIVAGTDEHELGPAREWTLLDIGNNNISEASIMASLRSKNKTTSFIFDEVGYQPPIISSAKLNPWYTFAYPWIAVGNFFHSFYQKVTGQYSFVDGYCGFGEAIVIRKKEIWYALFWVLLVWFSLEGGVGLIKFGISKIQQKLNPQARKRLLDDEGEQMEQWDAYL